ncbi:MAG: magnesium-protoporphyrin monomethyl ester (oxidative) cyclase [Cyanobacteriota bacterium]|jgi:magnesium-protoporphyrin IX monomethyl ester (oxidative) cyclase
MISAPTAKQVVKKTEIRDTLLTPRFWTTDFEELGALDCQIEAKAIDAVLQEFSEDYNQQHFVRDSRFDNALDSFSDRERELFLAFLERSCTSEYSGFLLYKEASSRLKEKNPILAKCFHLLSRDEARHAGFLNRAMADFGLSLDLPRLSKNRNYTFIKPKFLFYATYLSEKIGYWKYTLMFNHFKDNPHYVKHPIFMYFHNWCQDENRHGDFMGAVLKSQHHWLEGFLSRWQIRLFLLLFVLTTYFSGQKVSEFYEMLGIDVEEYDIQVLKETNRDVSKIFPIYLDLDNPLFIKLLKQCAENNEGLRKNDSFLGKVAFYISNCYNIFRMYLIPVKSSLPRGTVC